MLEGGIDIVVLVGMWLWAEDWIVVCAIDSFDLFEVSLVGVICMAFIWIEYALTVYQMLVFSTNG